MENEQCWQKPPWCVRINFNITIQSLIRHKNFQNYAHSCKQDSQIYAIFPALNSYNFTKDGEFNYAHSCKQDSRIYAIFPGSE